MPNTLYTSRNAKFAKCRTNPYSELKTIVVGFFFIIHLLLSKCAFSEEAKGSSALFHEDNEVILDYSLLNEGVVLRSNIVSYRYNDSLYIDLFLLSDILGLNVSIDSITKMLMISIVGESEKIYVDTKKCLYIKKEVLSFDCQEVAESENSVIYISTQLLSQLFKIELTADYKNSILYFKPLQNFPLFTKLLRTKLVQGSDYENNEYILLKDSESRLIKGFSANFSDVYQFSSSQKPSFNSFNSQLGALIDKYELSAIYNSQKYKWLSMERNFFEDESGSEKISKIKIGNYLSNGGIFYLGSQKLNGLYVTNREENEVDSNLLINIEGDLPRGFDVDLYKNEQLIAQLKDNKSGRYVFENNKLGIGKNLFKLIFYGPRGEVYEEYKSYSIDSEKFNKKNHYLLYSGLSDSGIRYDLLKYKTVFGQSFYNSPSYSKVTYKDRSKNFYIFDHSLFFNRVVFSNQAVASNSFEGNKLSATFDFSDSSLVYDQIFLHKDSYDEFLKLNLNNIRSDHRLSFHSTFLGYPNMRNNLYFNSRKFHGENQNQESINNTLSFNYNRIYLDNTVEKYLGEPLSQIQSTSNLVWSTALHQIQARIDFSLADKLKGFNLDYRYNENDKLTLVLGSYLGLKPKSISSSAGLGYAFNTFKLGVNASYSSEELTLNLNFETSLYSGVNIDENKTRIKFNSSRTENEAIIYITTFKDDNANGIKDDFEMAIPNVDIMFIATGEILTTNQYGRLIYTKAAAHQPLFLKVQEETLPDLNLSLAKKIKFFPRKAGINYLMIPIQSKYSITGISLKEKTSGFSEKNRLYLYSDKLELIQITRVDEDSEFIFEGVTSGKYILSSTELSKSGAVQKDRHLIIEVESTNLDIGQINF